MLIPSTILAYFLSFQITCFIRLLSSSIWIGLSPVFRRSFIF